MTPEELKTAIKEALAEERKNFWVDPERHFLDHQTISHLKCLDDRTSDDYNEDHRWVRSVRQTIGGSKTIIWRTGLGLIVACGLVWLGNMAWHFIISSVRATKL